METQGKLDWSEVKSESVYYKLQTISITISKEYLFCGQTRLWKADSTNYRWLKIFASSAYDVIYPRLWWNDRSSKYIYIYIYGFNVDRIFCENKWKQKTNDAHPPIDLIK